MSVESSPTLAESGLCSCHSCRKVVPSAQGDAACPRCGARLHRRRPDSLQETWALLLTAAIFLIPANLLPIMRVSALGRVGTHRSSIEEWK